MAEKLTLEVGVIKDERFRFAKRGNIKMQCPQCGMDMEIIITGLPENLSITPTVDWKHEWWCELDG